MAKMCKVGLVCGGEVLIREVKELKEVNLIYCSRLFSISEVHDIAWL